MTMRSTTVAANMMMLWVGSVAFVPIKAKATTRRALHSAVLCLVPQPKHQRRLSFIPPPPFPCFPSTVTTATTAPCWSTLARRVSSTSNQNDSETAELTRQRQQTHEEEIRIENEKSISMAAEPPVPILPPWNNPEEASRARAKKKNNNRRFRQHVNPLASRYQQPTVLPVDWPQSVYTDCTKFLHLDIGCGKGGFLLEYMKKQQQQQQELKNLSRDYNNGNSDTDKQKSMSAAQSHPPLQPSLSFNGLGLEIRPAVAQLAKERVATHNLTGTLDFLGCNVNVDLQRILTVYHQAAAAELAKNKQATENGNEHPLLLQTVSIQFPDPHFKSHHAKRRVVTSELVQTLAQFMPPASPLSSASTQVAASSAAAAASTPQSPSIVVLQSDVQSVLDDMRLRLRLYGETYFQDSKEQLDEYWPENWFGTHTERELSVLDQGLPVYRAVFYRNDVPFSRNISSAVDSHSEQQ